MPLLIVVIALSAIAGLVARRPVAYATTGVLVFLVNLSFVWAVADGKGDDPAWIIPIGLVGGALALVACRATQNRREARERTSAPA